MAKRQIKPADWAKGQDVPPDFGTFTGTGPKSGLGRRFIGIDSNADSIRATTQRLMRDTDKAFTVEDGSTLQTPAYRTDRCPLCDTAIAEYRPITPHIPDYVDDATRKRLGTLSYCMAGMNDWAQVIRYIEA